MKIGSFRSRAVAVVASPHSASRRHHRRQERGPDLARTTSLTRRRHQPYTRELVAKAVRASHERSIRIDCLSVRDLRARGNKIAMDQELKTSSRCACLCIVSRVFGAGGTPKSATRNLGQHPFERQIPSKARIAGNGARDLAHLDRPPACVATEGPEHRCFDRRCPRELG
jgi:hypothetical protein